MKTLVLTFALLLTVLPARSETSQFVKAEIYYFGWSVVTGGRLRLDTIRQAPRIRTVMTEPFEVNAFAKWLRIDEMRKQRRDGDPRLVIDLFDKAGARTTFYSDGADLIAEDGSAWRPIGTEFRARFTFSQTR